MEATKNSNNSTNIIVRVLEYILQFLYDSYYDIKKVLKENWLLTGILVTIFSLSGLMYYLTYFNPYNIMDYIKTPTTILYVFAIAILISMYSYFATNKTNVEIFKPVIKYLKLIGIIIGMYFFVSMFYYISKNVLYYGSKESAFSTIVIIICLMGLVYNVFFKSLKKGNSDSKIYNVYNLFIDIIFYIPCLFIDLIEYIKEDYKNTPSSTFILSGIIICILLFFYALPYLVNILKKDKGIQLLKEQSELNKNLVFINQKELREKIIKNRPILERQLLNFSKNIENQYEINGKYFNTTLPIFDKTILYKNQKYLDTYNTFSSIEDHEFCNNTSITCDASGILTCDNKKILDAYNIYQRCNNKDSFFDSLFRSPKDSIKIYPTSSLSELKTLQQMCDIDPDVSNVTTSVNCISYNDISNQVYDNDNYDDELSNNSLYFCNNVNVDISSTAINSNGELDKFKPIYGYNDIDGVAGPIRCNVPIVYEGFEGNIHNLDNLINNKNLLSEFSDQERVVLERAISSEETNLKYIVEKFKDDPQKVKEYIIAFFASNDNFLTLMDYVNKYNNDANIFLDQNLSSLIQQINLRSNIHEYNYHYGISFWIYFDSSILNNDITTTNNEGLIMSYADQPRIYYDYNTSELKIDVLRDQSSESDAINYKTKDILYQKWNHFVINYNYGTLDIFVNNNLVGSIDKLNPYVGNNNNIVFGSSSQPLKNSGICNIKYYEIPLKLSKINEMYKKHENPCI